MGEEHDIKHLGLDVAIKEWVDVEVGGKHFRFRINRPSGHKTYKLQINAPLDFTFTREHARIKGPRVRKPMIRPGRRAPG